MADNTYKVIFEDKTSGGSEVGGGSAQQTTGQSKGGAADKSKNTLAKTVAKVWSASALVRTGIEATEQIITRNMGNSQVAAKIGAVNSLVTQGIGIGLAFAIGGPVAGGLAIASVGLSYARQAEQFNYDRRWEGYGLQMTYERAGPSFNRSRR